MASVRLMLGHPRLRLAPKRRFKEQKVTTFKQWKVLRGDTVALISGKDAGQKGVVTKVLRSRNQVIVEGCNLVKRTIKGSSEQKGGMITKSMPIHVSNVMLVHPTTGAPTRVRMAQLDPNDRRTKQRVTKSEPAVVVPRPEILKQRRKPLPKHPGPLDTPLEQALKVTYRPPARLIVSPKSINKLGEKQDKLGLKQGTVITKGSSWLKYYTQEGTPYYWNKVTNQSVWHLTDARRIQAAIEKAAKQEQQEGSQSRLIENQ